MEGDGWEKGGREGELKRERMVCFIGLGVDAPMHPTFATSLTPVQSVGARDNGRSSVCVIMNTACSMYLYRYSPGSSDLVSPLFAWPACQQHAMSVK